jgi:Stage II sporulation protein E (SpoIIE)
MTSTATPAAPRSTTPPQIAGATRQEASSRTRRAAHPVPGRTGTAAAARGALTSSGPIAVTTARSSRPKRARATAKSPARGPSPLVTTITRIVGVVPTPVRVLIGALVALALALAVRSRLGALRARRLEHQRGQLLEDVGLLQTALLPELPARLGPVGTSAAYRPAAGPGAGGDFYDVFALEDGQLAIIVGDVSGHGRQALPHTALVRFTLRAYLEAGLSPRSALQTAGAVLERQLGDSFATVVAATYHPRDRVLVYACAGHPPPVVTGSRSIAPVTVCSAPPIGAGMRTGTRQTVVSVPGRAQICFYTDGVVEARVGAELFGAGRLTRTLAELGPDATASALLDRVSEAADTRPDDMAACVLRVEGGSSAPILQFEELELDRHEAASERAERFLLAFGVETLEIAEILRSARVTAGRVGTVLLELRTGDGATEVALRHDNVALLHAAAAATASAPGMSR